MKKFLWIAGGICAAAAGYLVWGAIQTRAIAEAAPVEDLAHQLETAWLDHHTLA